MKYSDIAKIWLEARDKGTKAKQEKGYPAYKLDSEDIQEALNAFDAEDLYNRPSQAPRPFSYGADAFQVGNRQTGMGIGPMILLANSGSSRLPINTVKNEQVAYQHELGHAQDPRLLDLIKNRGYLKRYGLPGALYSRESPAFESEDRYAV